jgi:hypothetical protein
MKPLKIGIWSLCFLSIFVLVPIESYTVQSIVKPESKIALNIVLFGDSDFFYPPTMSKDDYYSFQIGGFLQSYMPRSRITQWVKAGARIRDYEHALQFVKEHQYASDLLIIPINWRSFGEDWLRNSARDYEKEPVVMEEVYHFHPYLLPFIHLRDSLAFRSFLRKQDTLKRLRQPYERPARLALPRLKMCFPIVVEPKNKTLGELQQFMPTVPKEDTQTLFVLLPIPKHFPCFTGQEQTLETSIASLCTTITDNGFQCLDLSDAIPPDGFYDDTGHLLIPARAEVARRIAHFIKNQTSTNI